MKKYQVMIDGEMSSRTFTLDEMLDLGLLDDYDEKIKIKAIGEASWSIARDYPFYLSESQTFTANEDGSVTRKKGISMPSDYTIDEYGQVVRRKSGNVRFSVSTDSLHFTDSGSSRTINITSSGSWSVSVDAASWVTLLPNGDSITVRVNANLSPNSRTDYFILKSGSEEKKVSIYQSGTNRSHGASSDESNGCAWAIAIGVGIMILAAILS